MQQQLVGRRVAFLVMDNFEQAELTGPKKGLEDAGARVQIASAKAGRVTSMKHDEKSDQFQVDKTFDQLDACDYDAVMLPGGVFNADAIRSETAALQFVRDMAALNKPIGVICHAPWLLISAGLLKGRTLTSWPSLKDDLKNAGASWIDREVVVDGNLVSSRKPDDIAAFNEKLIEVMVSAGAVQHA
jgi:protease I